MCRNKNESYRKKLRQLVLKRVRGTCKSVYVRVDSCTSGGRVNSHFGMIHVSTLYLFSSAMLPLRTFTALCSALRYERSTTFYCSCLARRSESAVVLVFSSTDSCSTRCSRALISTPACIYNTSVYAQPKGV